MDNKKTRRYLVWLLIGAFIIVGGVLGNALLGNGEPMADQTLKYTQTSNGNIEKTDDVNKENTRNLVYARSSHTATTLTDGRLLVVGGLGSDRKPMSKVEIYDPKTDTWTATADCRSPRADHTATLLKTGNVLVVGGTSDVGVASTAEIFDLKSQTWEYAGRMYFARQTHRATLLNDGRVLITGGKGVNKAIDAVELYNPVTKAWTRAGSLNFPKYGHTASLLPDGNVLVAGGGEGFVRQVHGEIFYPESSTWRSLTSIMDIGRGGHTATSLNNGSILFVGGTQDSNRSSMYSISDESWTEGAVTEKIRDNHTATLMDDGRVLIAGGGVTTMSAELYDPETQTWSSAGDMNISRREHTSTVLNNGNVLIVGGQHGGQITSLVEIFDPKTDRWDAHNLEGKWTDTNIMNIPRKNHTSTLLPDGSVLVAGGITRVDEGATQLLSQAERYLVDGIKGWTMAGKTSITRTGHTASLLADGKVLIAGGGSVDNALDEVGQKELKHLNSTEMYDYKTNTWLESSGMNVPRWEHTATVLSSGNILVVGGENTDGPLSSTELFNVENKEWVILDDLSYPRARHVAVLLSDNRVLVAGGGNTIAEIYDVQSNKWTDIGGLSQNLNLSSASALPNGKAIIVGGYGVDGAQYQVEIYNPEFDTWNMGPKIPKPRVRASFTELEKKSILLAGGNQYTHSWILDTATLTWTKGAKMLKARTGQSATQLSEGRVLVSGGENRKGEMESSSEVYVLIQE